MGTLTFEVPDLARFPGLRVAIAALKTGGGLPTVFNAANEVAVEAFVARRIGFSDIVRIVEATCEAALAEGIAPTPTDVAEALAVDHVARERAAALLH